MNWQEFQDNFLDFDGRINRLPFLWKPIAVGLVISLLLMLCELVLPQGIMNMLFRIAPILNVIINASFIVRRCHDVNLNSWWALVMLVPLANFVFYIYLLVKEGTPGYNDYGRNPLD